ncbi:MAG: hypothetical protein IAE80_22525 [Anaerolinea sp.]|nr:hypothetical protein [Anaerolinea sp.]
MRAGNRSTGKVNRSRCSETNPDGIQAATCTHGRIHSASWTSVCGALIFSRPIHTFTEVIMKSETHLLMAGSRYSTRAALTYARRAVQRAHQLGWIILVGDNPKGIDMAVVQECRRLKTKVIVAGVANFPRNGGYWHGSYLKVTRDLYRSAGGNLLNGYTARDRWLVDNCQRALFIWNGNSPGTKAAYDYAVQRGKTADLIRFDVQVHPHD